MKEVKFFLFLGLDKILLRAQNSKKEFFFKKEILLNCVSIEENFNNLQIFLENNVIPSSKCFLIKCFRDLRFIKS